MKGLFFILHDKHMQTQWEREKERGREGGGETGEVCLTVSLPKQSHSNTDTVSSLLSQNVLDQGSTNSHKYYAIAGALCNPSTQQKPGANQSCRSIWHSWIIRFQWHLWKCKITLLFSWCVLCIIADMEDVSVAVINKAAYGAACFQTQEIIKGKLEACAESLHCVTVGEHRKNGEKGGENRGTPRGEMGVSSLT